MNRGNDAKLPLDRESRVTAISALLRRTAAPSLEAGLPIRGASGLEFPRRR